MFAREAIPDESTHLDPWSDDYKLLRRHARPYPQVSIDEDFEIPRLYVRAPGRASKQRAGNQAGGGNFRKQNKVASNPSAGHQVKPPLAPQGESPGSGPKSTKTSTKDTPPMVRQNYNWPPPGYDRMNTGEKRVAAMKARQQGPKSESTIGFPAPGSFVRGMTAKFEHSISGSPLTKQVLSQNYAEAANAVPKKDIERPTPISHQPHAPGSGASSWASLSRSSSVGAGTLSRQNSGKSTLSGVHVEKPAASKQEHSDIGDGWTEL